MIHLVEHFIQRDILRKLSRTGQTSFSALQPQGIENGVFAYHLKTLVTRGLVVHHKDRYALSIEGLRYVAQVTRTNLDIQPQPKLFGLLIIENEKGEYVLHRRAAEPFLGRYTFPGGVLFFDETPKELAARQLLEKIGVEIVVENRGMASLRLGENDHTLSHTYAHLFYGMTDSSTQLRAKDARFTPEWVHVHGLSKAELLPDVLDILDAIQRSKDYFFLDLHLTQQQDLTVSQSR